MAKPFSNFNTLNNFNNQKMKRHLNVDNVWDTDIGCPPKWIFWLRYFKFVIGT